MCLSMGGRRVSDRVFYYTGRPEGQLVGRGIGLCVVAELCSLMFTSVSAQEYTKGVGRVQEAQTFHLFKRIVACGMCCRGKWISFKLQIKLTSTSRGRAR